MDKLQRLIAAYDAMDERAKDEIVEEAEDLALRWPAECDASLVLPERQIVVGAA